MKNKILDAVKNTLRGMGGYGRPQLQPVPVRVGK